MASGQRNSSPSSEETITESTNEATPLLSNAGTDDVQKASHRDDATTTPTSTTPTVDDIDDNKPLPKSQLLLLCYARLVEPIAFFSIFPFINAMIYRLGRHTNPPLTEADVGFWSGAIESLFSLTQMCLMIPWGWLADRVGRKPVLVLSLAGVSVATAAFGLSERLFTLVIFRCLAGVFAGTIVTIRTMISEISTKKTQARSFSWFAFTNNLGIFIGPVLGGALADPVHQFPSVFGQNAFFTRFPYVLPTIVAGAIGATASILCALLIKETLVRDKGSDPAKNSPPMSTLEILRSHGVAPVLYIYGYVMLLAFAYTAVAPVFYFTPVRLGGFGFSPLMISIFMAINGLSQSIWILIAFPYLQKKFGTGGVLRGCAIAYPFFFIACPLCNAFLRRGWDAAFWVVGLANVVFGSGVSMSFTACQLALNDISPSHSTLGTLNAVALAFISGLRAFAPATFTSIYAIGVRNQIMGGYLAWFIMILLASGVWIILKWLPEEAEGKVDT